jgi:Transposase DNA-binding/Transposase DDE domain
MIKEIMGTLDVASELSGGKFGDPRLAKRAESIARLKASQPGASLPVAMGTPASREAAYRFLSNRRVTLARVIAPHVEATVGRAREAGRVLVISDTTEFKFSTEREGLGYLSTDRQDGFLGHFTLALSADGKRTPLGVLGIETIARVKRKGGQKEVARKRDPSRESLRWQRCAQATDQKLEGVEAIHVMDAEADIYELMANLVENGRHFIIRSAQDRLLSEGRLSSAVAALPMQFSREVKLSARSGSRKPESRRSHPPRTGRIAELAVSTTELSIKKAKSSRDPALPDFITVNLVRVWEPKPPLGEDPVEWRLFTTEPVATQAQIEAVVDNYRARWTIEEYFKALKTGCAYEKAQLESFEALQNLLAIYAPVAWQLLLLRSAARDEPDRPAIHVLSTVQLTVLRLIARGKPMPAAPTVAHAFNAIAELGAHIKSNGPPGWQVLGRGFEELRRAETLYTRMNSGAS